MPKQGTVTTNLLNVRNGPGTFGTIIGGLKSDTAIKVLEQVDSEWAKVKLPDGKEGFAATAFLNIVETTPSTPPAPQPTFTPYRVSITTRQLNVRSGPGTNFGVIGTLNTDDVVTVLEELGE